MTRHLSPLFMLLAVLLLAPGVGRATEEQPPPAEAPTSAPYSPYTPPVRKKPHVILRVLGETGAGLLTSQPVGLVGLLLGLGGCGNLDLTCPLSLGTGYVLGMSAGFSLGVLWSGMAMGVRSHPLAALSGTLLAVGGSLLASLVAPIRDGPFMASMFVYSIVLAPLGALCSLVLFEATQEDRPRPVPAPVARAVSRPRVVPTLAVSSRGALFGLGGTF